MKNSKKLNAIVMLIALVVGLNNLIIGQPGQGKGRGQNAVCERIPDLTTEQQDKINELKTGFLMDTQETRNLMAEKKAHLRTLRTAEKPDMKAIDETIDEMSALRDEMAKKRERHIQEVRSLLTDEQRVVFDQMKGHRQGKGGPRNKGKGYGMRDCPNR